MTAQTTDFQISEELRGDLRRWRSRALPIGVAGLVVSGIGIFFGRQNVDQFYHSYLWSYLFLLGLALGPLAWLLLQYLSGGAWGMVIRRPCEAALRTMPLVALLFLPIVAGIPNLYAWSHQANVDASAVLQHKHAYLNVPFFLARAAFYFAGWLFLCWYYNRVSYREDTEGHDAVHGSMSTLAGPGIIFWAFTTTFMSIDWILSVHPEFFSTMFGLLFIAGQGLTGMAFLITVMVLLSRRRPMSDVLTPAHLHDLGKLLLAMVMVWAYFSFSQFLIIWAGNLPEEIPYYLKRINGGWGFLALVLVFGHFALPFALLLSRDLKRNFKLLASIAIFVLCMRLVDLYWVVTPEFRGGAFGISWMDITVPAGLIGVWLAYFLYQLEKRPLMPVNNPHLEEALQHGRE
ncbi:MAG TPA: hypothetical protein VMB03_01530 [Bryobacteraceae bacterium]|nr:hypothetical protein [Bryobacteraceae bacterium]